MIDHAIPDQALERIRDRVARILKCEFENQANQYQKDHCRGVKFFAERRRPIDKSEMAVIVLSLWKAKYSNKEPEYVDGTYSFVLDIMANGYAKGEVGADTMAGYRAQKMFGAVRYILEHSMYETLEFDRPFILHTSLSDFQMLKFDEQGRTESGGTSQGQAVFTVRCGETTGLPAGSLTDGVDTIVKLDETEYGYEYNYTF